MASSARSPGTPVPCLTVDAGQLTASPLAGKSPGRKRTHVADDTPSVPGSPPSDRDAVTYDRIFQRWGA
jgi:hypothetical protein